MTQASQADRSRAHRLGKRDASSLSPEDAAWLEDYKSKARRRTPTTQSTTPQGTTVTVSDAEPRPTPSGPNVDHEAGFVEIDFGKPQSAIEHTQQAEAGRCTIKDCPRCKSVGKYEICAETGQKVYPRMTDSAANGMASMVLGLIAFVARMMRKDKAFIMPTDTERKAMADALKETMNLRFNSSGAVADLFATIFVLGAFTRRAFTAKAPELPPDAANAPG